MLFNYTFNSPLDQFDIIPLFNLRFGFLDFSITNETVVLILVFFFVSVLFSSFIKKGSDSFYIVPSRWQAAIEIVYKAILSMLIDNVNLKQGQPFFPLLFTIFFFIVSLNLIGIVPYSFTLTSHLIVTFALSLFLFLGINIICIKQHKLKFFSLFLPSGTSMVLAFLLVPIELISYIFKPISLSIRLFANMMAGHTLLKVIAGFAWTLMKFSGVLFILHYVPLLILIPLLALEVGIALIQAFVFSILFCVYLNDAIHLH